MIYAIYDKTSIRKAATTMIGQAQVSNGAWSLRYDSAFLTGKPAYFMVGCPNGNSWTYYITKSPVEIPSTGISNLELKASDLELWAPAN
jgi:hypothetical protein